MIGQLEDGSMELSQFMAHPPAAIKVKACSNVFHPEIGDDELQPLTPESIFHVEHKYHDILLKFVFVDRVEASELRDLARDTICHHPRFHSRVKTVAGSQDTVWVSVPVDLTWHVVDEGEVEEEANDGDFEEQASEKGVGATSGMLRTVEQFAVRIHAAPRFDFSRPLWQMHLLHVSRAASTDGTLPAAAAPSTYSILIFRVNHAVGDLTSLMALVNDCANRTPPPPSPPPLSSSPLPIPSQPSTSLPPPLTTFSSSKPLPQPLSATSFSGTNPPTPHPSQPATVKTTAVALCYSLWVFTAFGFKELYAIATPATSKAKRGANRAAASDTAAAAPAAAAAAVHASATSTATREQAMHIGSLTTDDVSDSAAAAAAPAAPAADAAVAAAGNRASPSAVSPEVTQVGMMSQLSSRLRIALGRLQSIAPEEIAAGTAKNTSSPADSDNSNAASPKGLPGGGSLGRLVKGINGALDRLQKKAPGGNAKATAGNGFASAGEEDGRAAKFHGSGNKPSLSAVLPEEALPGCALGQVQGKTAEVAAAGTGTATATVTGAGAAGHVSASAGTEGREAAALHRGRGDSKAIPGGGRGRTRQQHPLPTVGMLFRTVWGGLEFVHTMLVPDTATCIRNEGVMQDWGRWSIGGGMMESTFGCMEPIDMVRLNRVRKSLGATVNDVLVAVIAGGLDRYLLSMGELGSGSTSSSKDGEVGKVQATKKERRKQQQQPRVRACSFVNLRGVALARVSSPDWWLNYQGVGSSLKGPWGNVLGVHTVSLPLWGPKAAHCNDCGGNGKQQKQQRWRWGQGSYSEKKRVAWVKSQFDRKKRSYEAHYVRIQWDRQSVGAQALIVSHLCNNATVGVSNIEGPRQPITLAGHRVRDMCVSSFGLPLGVNFQIYSYAGSACVSATSLKAFLPDASILCAYMNEAFKALEVEVLL